MVDAVVDKNNCELNVQRGGVGWLLGWLGLRLVQMVEYNTRAVDLERDSATAKIAQRRKSAGTIRQAAWPVTRERTKPPPRTRPLPPCRGRPRRIHPAGTDEHDQSTFSHI